MRPPQLKVQSVLLQGALGYRTPRETVVGLITSLLVKQQHVGPNPPEITPAL